MRHRRVVIYLAGLAVALAGALTAAATARTSSPADQWANDVSDLHLPAVEIETHKAEPQVEPQVEPRAAPPVAQETVQRLGEPGQLNNDRSVSVRVKQAPDEGGAPESGSVSNRTDVDSSTGTDPE